MTESNFDVGPGLGQTLTDLLNLGLAAKHAQWNLVGPRFLSLHLLLDELAEVARDASNRVAERSIQLGGHPDGRIETVAANDALPLLEVGPLRDDDAITVFPVILETVTTRLFISISDAGWDPVTHDLLVGIAARLEKLAWMIRAHDTR